MNSKQLFDLLSYASITFTIGMAAIGTIELLVAITTGIQDRARANRNINTEVPALKTSMKELQTRQSRMDSELQQLRRFREHDATAKGLPSERGAELPRS